MPIAPQIVSGGVKLLLKWRFKNVDLMTWEIAAGRAIYFRRQLVFFKASVFDDFFHTVTFSLNHNRFGVMQKSIKQC